MSSKKAVIDASDRFPLDGSHYVVRIEVKPTIELWLKLLASTVSGKTLRISHTFGGNPFVTPNKE